MSSLIQNLNAKFLFLTFQKERSKTKGKDWFNLPAQEMTEEVKNELELIRMRSVLDPKHFYKRSEMKTLPKYFQVKVKLIECNFAYFMS